MEEELKEEIRKLKNRIDRLEGKRIFQQDIMPAIIKTRHIDSVETGLFFATSGSTKRIGIGSLDQYFYSGASGDININGSLVCDTDLRVDGDSGSGTSGQNTFTGAMDTPTADPGWATSSTVNMTAPDGYIKIYVGTQAVVVPYWNT